MKIYTIGHISPDLDAITSAVAYAEYLKISKKYGETEIIALRPGQPNKEVESIFAKFSVTIPTLIDEVEISNEDKFILVDHNEASQRHPKIQNDRIIEILDHHKVNVSFNSPITIDVKAWGATSTLIFDLFEKSNLTPSVQIASILLSAIISDTLSLKSATTTAIDKSVLQKLSSSFNLNIDELTFEVFKAKSDLSGLTPIEIIKKDYKNFDFGGKKVFISTVETVEPDKVLESKTELVAALSEVKKSENADLGFIFVSDILKIFSIGIYETEIEQGIINKAFNVTASDNSVKVGPITSRKKDIAPAIEKALL